MSTVRATTAFWAPSETARPIYVEAGDVFDSEDPIIKGRESLFESTDDAAKKRPEAVFTAAKPAKKGK